MRRMYSEKELSVLVYQAVGQYIEDGALDELVSDAVDAYLVEHPVDITALEGQDIALATLTSTGDVDVGGDLDVTGSISGAEIVEKMSGYSWTKTGDAKVTQTDVYVGIVKNGNKLTLVYFGECTVIDEFTGAGNITLGHISIPSSVGAKLYPYTLGLSNNILSQKGFEIFSDLNTKVSSYTTIEKYSNTQLNIVLNLKNAVLNSKYMVRVEVTFLLSDNLVNA